MERNPGEREPLLGHVGSHGSSINNPGGLLDYSSNDSTPTDSITYGSVQLEPQRVYKRRWYCLLMYSLLCFIFGLSQTAISPIAHSVQLAFGWSYANIAVLSSLSPLMYMFAIVYCTWLLDSKGVRVACLFAAVAQALGTGVRCITSTTPWCNWTFNIGQLLIGLTGTVVYGSPTTFSNIWFPPEQRTLATSASGMANALGLGVGSVLAPYLVKVRYMKHHNATIHNNFTTPEPQTNTTAGLPTYIQEMRESIMSLMYIQFGLSLAILLALLIYFPSKPPTPPSASASSDRVHFCRGLVAIFRQRQFWVLAGMFAISTGAISGMSALLDVDLVAAHVPGDQSVTGYLILSAIMASVVACLIIASIADRLRQYVKYVLLVLFTLGTGAFTWFALIIEDVAPASYVSLYVSYILGYSLVISGTPVFMELTCDATYPISEGITTGALTLFSNVVSIIFFAILMVPAAGTKWINWAMVGSAALCIPLLISFTPSAGRMQIDANREIDDSEKTNSYGTNTCDTVDT